MSPLLAFMMPGPTEMVIIGVIAVLLFGRKLPKLAFDLGSSFTQFKKGISIPMEELTECRDTVTRETHGVKNTIEKETRDVEKAVRDA